MSGDWFDSYLAGDYVKGVTFVTPSAPDPDSAGACVIRRRPTDPHGGQHPAGTAVTAATTSVTDVVADPRLILVARMCHHDFQKKVVVKRQRTLRPRGVVEEVGR